MEMYTGYKCKQYDLCIKKLHIYLTSPFSTISNMNSPINYLKGTITGIPIQLSIHLNSVNWLQTLNVAVCVGLQNF